jgi:predicted acetyltransferase
VTFHLPPDHPAAAIAVDLGATFTRRTFRNAAGMMRILNLNSTLEAMEAELAARWRASAMGHCGLELTFHTDVGRAKLLLAGTRRSSPPTRGRIRIGQDRLIQLITGYVGASAMAERPEVGIPRNLLPALAAVFPERNAHILRTNRF